METINFFILILLYKTKIECSFMMDGPKLNRLIIAEIQHDLNKFTQLVLSRNIENDKA